MYSIFSTVVVGLGLALLIVFKNSLSELTSAQKVVIGLIGIFSAVALLTAVPDAISSFIQGWNSVKN